MALKNFSLTYADGEPYNLQDYEGYVILIVNTAMACGLATQFEELENLYQKYKDEKFVVLGFPSNQFKQEPTEDREMATTAKEKFGVTFPFNEAIVVNGEDAHPLFKWLKEEQGGVGDAIKWNFTKFLLDRNGKVVERFAPTTKPSHFEDEIKKLL